MDLRGFEIDLARKRWEKVKSLNGKEKIEETMRVLRIIFPLVADTRGKEVLEVYTELKISEEALKKAEKLVEDILSSL